MSTLHHGAEHRDPLAPHASTAAELQAILVAERGGRPMLVFRDEGGALQIHVLPDGGGPVMVGRRQGVDLRIGWDRETSGVHAELRCLGGEWTIMDDGLSTNGTFVNARRVNGRQRLRDEDRVRVGQTVLVYNAAVTGPVEETVTGRKCPPQLDDLSGSQRRVLIALCRPQLTDGPFSAPASNQQIADEVFLSLDAVKMQLRGLFSRFDLNELPQNQKRAGLAQFALRYGLVSPHDL